MFEKINIQLGRNGEENLSFSILDTEVAQRWAYLVKEELHLGGIRERDRFVSFNEDVDLDIKNRITSVKNILSKIKGIRKDIDFGLIDFSNIQKEVNRIHVNFADKHLEKNDFHSEEESNLWTLLNVILHQLENLLVSSFCLSEYKLLNSKINVTFHQRRERELIPKDNFKDAKLYERFGFLYLGYSRVGRHIHELFYSNDMNIPLSHVHPFTEMSADFNCYFGPTGNEAYHLKKLSEVEKWFHKNKVFFDKLGLPWSKKELGLGHIPVARLSGFVETIENCKEIQKRIARRPYIYDIEVF